MDVGTVPDGCMVRLLSKTGVDGLGVGNGDTNGIGANKLAAGGDPVVEVDVKARDFQGFLPKSELISQLI